MLAKLIALTIPLTLDSFLITAAIGLSHPPLRQRLRISGFFALFEGGMPLIGLLFGAAISGRIGGTANIVAGGLLVVFGLYTALHHSGEEDEARRLVSARGLAIIGLGLGISLDGLAIGFTYGVLRLPVVLTTAVIVAQAFLATQLGFALGARIKPGWRRYGELLAGWALVAIGVFVLWQELP